MDETPIWIALGILAAFGLLLLILFAIEGWHRRGERRVGTDSSGDANAGYSGDDAGSDGGGGDGGGGGGD